LGCGLFKKSAVTATFNSCSAKKDVKPEQVRGAIASLSMLSYRGKEAFPPVKDELSAVPLPREQRSQAQSNATEEIPDW
jgi:integrase/recombinase XerD